MSFEIHLQLLWVGLFVRPQMRNSITYSFLEWSNKLNTNIIKSREGDMSPSCVYWGYSFIGSHRCQIIKSRLQIGQVFIAFLLNIMLPGVIYEQQWVSKGLDSKGKITLSNIIMY